MKPSKPDTSKQEKLLKQQQAQLKEDRKMAEMEAARLREQRIAKSAAGKRGGRQSLIKTSELGVKDKLG